MTKYIILIVLFYGQIVKSDDLIHFNMSGIYSDYASDSKIDSLVYHYNSYFDKQSGIDYIDLLNSNGLLHEDDKLFLDTNRLYGWISESSKNYYYLIFGIDETISDYCISIDKKSLKYEIQTIFDTPNLGSSYQGIYQNSVFIKYFNPDTTLIVNLDRTDRSIEYIKENYNIENTKKNDIGEFFQNDFYVQNSTILFFNYDKKYLEHYNSYRNCSGKFNHESYTEIVKNNENYPILWGINQDCFLNLSSILPNSPSCTGTSDTIYLLNHYVVGKYQLASIYNICNNYIEKIFDSNNYKHIIYNEFTPFPARGIFLDFQVYKNLIFMIMWDYFEQNDYVKNITGIGGHQALLIFDLAKKEFVPLPDIKIVE